MLLNIIYRLIAVGFLIRIHSASIEQSVCNFVAPDDLDEFPDEHMEPVAKEKKKIFLTEDKTKCRESTSLYTSKNGEGWIKLKCEKGVIVNISAVAVAKSKVRCTEQTEELKVSSLDCWWKKECMIKYVPYKMFFPLDNIEACFRKPSDSVELSYSCLHQDIPVFDIIPSIQTINSSKGYIETWDGEIPPYMSLLSNGRFRIQIFSPSNEQCGHFMFANLKGKFIKGNHWFVNSHNFNCSEFDNHEFQVMYLNSSSFNVDLRLDNVKQIVPFRFYFEWCPKDKSWNKISYTDILNSPVPKFSMIRDIKSDKTKGIIRSHPNYPWHYPRNVGLFEKTSKFIKTSYYHLVHSPAFSITTLNIQLLTLNIAAFDKLRFVVQYTNDTENALDLEELNNYTCFECKQLKINFTVVNAAQGYHPSKSGFLIAYEWSNGYSEMDFFYPATKCSQTDKVKCPGNKHQSCNKTVRKKLKRKRENKEPRKQKRDKKGKKSKSKKTG